MRRSRAKFSSDALDVEIQGFVTTARRSLGRAVDLCVQARRDEPRHVNRARYKILMDLLTATEMVRSTVPKAVEDPDLYPEALRDQVQGIEHRVRRANRALREARQMLEQAESEFRDVEATFAMDEINAIEGTEAELRFLVSALEGYRGVRGSRREVEKEPIPSAKQERRRAVPPKATLPPSVVPWE